MRLVIPLGLFTTREMLRWDEVGHLSTLGRAGAGDRIRTGDIDLGKVALYQLSYSRTLETIQFPAFRHSCQ